MTKNFIRIRSAVQKWLEYNSDNIVVLKRPTNVIIKYSVQINPKKAEAAPIEISIDSEGYVYFYIDKYIQVDRDSFYGKSGEQLNQETYVLDVLKNVSLGNLDCYDLVYRDKVIGYGGALHLDDYDDCIYDCIPSFIGWVFVKASLAKKRMKIYLPYR